MKYAGVMACSAPKKTLVVTSTPVEARASGAPRSRGLHSSTFRLNLSAFCGIGVYSGVV